MPDKETASKEKQDQKMVPLAELVNFRQKSRQRETELKAQLEEAQKERDSLQEELKVASADVEEDEKLKNVRTYLVNREKKLAKQESDYSTKIASMEKREREANIRELVAEFRAKGVEVDAETLADEEEPRLKCMELYATHLEQKSVSKTDETKEETSEPQVFETGVHGVTKKQPKDMTDEEFAQLDKQLKADYYAKK